MEGRPTSIYASTLSRRGWRARRRGARVLTLARVAPVASLVVGLLVGRLM